MRIYHSWYHVAATSLIILLPLFFLYVFSQYVDIAADTLVADIGISLVRIVVAYVIALVLAWTFAVAFYRGERSKAALPIFDVLQSIPTFAALPIATALWGPSNATVIFFLVLAIIWPLFFSIISALKLIKHEWEDAVEVSGLRGMQYVRLFLFPVTVPAIITGSIIGLGDGWEALIATEIIIHTPSGLGSFFGRFVDNQAVTLFGILGFLLVIFAINKLVWLPLHEWSHKHMEE